MQTLRQLYHVLSLNQDGMKLDQQIFDIFESICEDDEPDYDHIAALLEDLESAGCIYKKEDDCFALLEHDWNALLTQYNTYQMQRTFHTHMNSMQKNMQVPSANQKGQMKQASKQSRPVMKKRPVVEEESEEEIEDETSEEEPQPRRMAMKKPVAATPVLAARVKVARVPPQKTSAPAPQQNQMVSAPTGRTINMPSFTEPGMSYQIDIDNATCSCPSFKYHGPCKHMQEIVDNPNDYSLNNNDTAALKNAFKNVV